MQNFKSMIFFGMIFFISIPAIFTAEVSQQSPVSSATEYHKTKFGLQMASDSVFGLMLYLNRLELSLKVQGKMFDGFMKNQKPNDLVILGGHISFLFHPSDRSDLGLGMELYNGIPLSGDIKYK